MVSTLKKIQNNSLVWTLFADRPRNQNYIMDSQKQNRNDHFSSLLSGAVTPSNSLQASVLCLVNCTELLPGMSNTNKLLTSKMKTHCVCTGQMETCGYQNGIIYLYSTWTKWCDHLTTRRSLHVIRSWYVHVCILAGEECGFPVQNLFSGHLYGSEYKIGLVVNNF